MARCECNYSIRVIKDENGCDVVVPDVLEAITGSLEFSMNELEVTDHLFVTLVKCQGFTSPEDNEGGIALYHEGIRHIAIATIKSEKWELTDEEWLEELQISVAHEVYHYWQDIQGTLGQGDYEDVAEDWATKTIKKLRNSEVQP